MKKTAICSYAVFDRKGFQIKKKWVKNHKRIKTMRHQADVEGVAFL